MRLIGAEGPAEIFRLVRDRLMQAPGMQHVPVDTIEIFVQPDFLTGDECDALIAQIDAGREPSRVLVPIDDPDYRTSDTCNLDSFAPLTQEIERKITALMGIAPRHGETIQGQRYAPGQRFKPHYDFFHTDQPYWPELDREGGQRTWTAMIYLNTPQSGGQTNFPNTQVTIPPRRGMLLTWCNLDAAGEPSTYSLHEGMPVLAGVKYIITKWYRERPWGVASRAPAVRALVRSIYGSWRSRIGQ